MSSRTTRSAKGAIPGAIHIPLGHVGARCDELDRERPVITVCGSGGRSARASAELEAVGFEAHTMAGGMVAWQAAGLPIS